MRGMFLTLLAVYLPVLLAAGFLIVLGVRGRTPWARPACRACGHDLAGTVPEETPACPKCQADLNAPAAARVPRAGARWRPILLGVALLLMPILGVGVSYVGARYQMRSGPLGPHNLGQQSNAALIQYTQQNMTGGGGWGWRELGERAKAGNLTSAEVDPLVQSIIAQVQTGGSNQAFHWIEAFLGPASAARVIEPARLVELGEALFGTLQTQPLQATATQLQPRGSRPAQLRFEIDRGTHRVHDDLGVTYLWHLNGITLNGEPIPMRDQRNWREQIWGHLLFEESPTPGTYDLVYEIELALVRSSHLLGTDPQELAPEDWPPALKRWPQELKTTLTVTP